MSNKGQNSLFTGTNALHLTEAEQEALRQQIAAKAQKEKDNRDRLRASTKKPKAPRPELVKALPPNSPAILNKGSLFPKSENPATEETNIFVRSTKDRKTGTQIKVGPWKGFPIYTVTLAERTTCWEGCPTYRTCYGNGMPFASRIVPDDNFLKLFNRQARNLAEKHPQGYMVRLHQLGDVYSMDYLNTIQKTFYDVPQMHIWMTTAWPYKGCPDAPEGSEIGDAIYQWRAEEREKAKAPDYKHRLAIWFSSKTAHPGSATTTIIVPDIENKGTKALNIGKTTNPVNPNEKFNNIVCPEQVGLKADCGSCGLCWSQSFNERSSIRWLLHGPNQERNISAEQSFFNFEKLERH